jgi:hypothetical protein
MTCKLSNQKETELMPEMMGMEGTAGSCQKIVEIGGRGGNAEI